MILSQKTNKEYHKNGKLAYIETKCVIAPMFEKIFKNLRVSENGDLWIRTGECVKYYDNGIIAWSLNYDDCGTLVNSGVKRRKDGSIIVH